MEISKRNFEALCAKDAATERRNERKVKREGKNAFGKVELRRGGGVAPGGEIYGPREEETLVSGKM